MDSKEKGDKFNSSLGKWARYTSLAFEMGIVIFAGAFGGLKLDEYFGTEKPWFTVALSLFAVFASIYIVIKGVKNEK
ncbi:MAG: AtpZ/AtpI family protein [Bacteroidales bacterium]|nr:AtpZ/AtpI family protein [Bacteroidales bacterium]